MADSRWETAADEEFDRALLALIDWVANMEKIWGPEWAKHQREQIEQQRKAGHARIRDYARQYADYQRQVERHYAAAGYKVTWPQ